MACPSNGPQGGADLDDRPLPAHRPARADANRGRKRLYDGHLRAHAPPLPVDHVHDLWNAVTSGLGREVADERPVDQAPDDWCEAHEPDPKSREVGVAGVPGRAVVTVPCEELGEPEDHVPKRNRAAPSADAHQQRKHRQPGRALEAGAPQPFGESRRRGT